TPEGDLRVLLDEGDPAKVVFFFFQAEDGIRDLIVTGVQTCALPILLTRRTQRLIRRACLATALLVTIAAVAQPVHAAGGGQTKRSEERRVGKECRTGWAREGKK